MITAKLGPKTTGATQKRGWYGLQLATQASVAGMDCNLEKFSPGQETFSELECQKVSPKTTCSGTTETGPGAG